MMKMFNWQANKQVSLNERSTKYAGNELKHHICPADRDRVTDLDRDR